MAIKKAEIKIAEEIDENAAMNETNEVDKVNENKEMDAEVEGVTPIKIEEDKKMAEVKGSNKVFYGNGAEVTPVGVLDYNDFSTKTKRDQKMMNFDPQYRDFVDYIMKITHQIWEEKGIGVIYDTYHNNVTMHLGTTNLVGVKDVIGNTLQTLHAFPDRRLIGQNVIWSDFGPEGYLSSHRVMSTATNLGDSNFGPATGKKINFRTVIDCATTHNRIHEEWLVRDNLWIVTQLGLDPHEVAKKMAKAAKNSVNSLQSSFGICESMEGQFVPEKYTAADDSIGEIVLEMLSHIYNYRYINKVKEYYHENATVHFVCNKDLNGYDEIQGMIISFLASVPTGSYEVERVTCTDRPNNDGYDVAVRWRLRGMNDGIGFFGQPSGKPLDIMGINHYHMLDNKVKEEWITFDGMDILKQKYMGDEE